MRKGDYTIFLLMICMLSSGEIRAQFSEEEIRAMNTWRRQKADLQQQFLIAEKHSVSEQDDFDVKYYSLNLVPDTAAQMLEGTVRIVGEVIAPTLNRVVFNFWDDMTVTDAHVTDTPGAQLAMSRGGDFTSIYARHELTQTREEALERYGD